MFLVTVSDQGEVLRRWMKAKGQNLWMTHHGIVEGGASHQAIKNFLTDPPASCMVKK